MKIRLLGALFLGVARSSTAATLSVCASGCPYSDLQTAINAAAQGDTIQVLHTLRPLVVVMAGADEFDPFKD